MITSGMALKTRLGGIDHQHGAKSDDGCQDSPGYRNNEIFGGPLGGNGGAIPDSNRCT